jgi:hypothetical protein
MKLWLLVRQDQGGYDTYDSCVVAAETADAAKLIHPSSRDYVWDSQKEDWFSQKGEWRDDTWAAPSLIVATAIGTASEGISGVQCASFNAG